MTIEEFKLFRALIYDICGIDFQPDKNFLLANRLRKRMEQCGISSYKDYYQYLTISSAGRDELATLVDSITINETSFFRNQPQFDILSSVVIPELVTRKKTDVNKQLRIWSAGCSSGQEPYSIAMTLLENIAFVDRWDIKILASDISLRMLEIASEGFYSLMQIKGVPQDYLDRYFTKNKDGYTIKDRVKKLVTFDYHNLKHNNGLQEFDVIFCRNVMIYFDQEGCKQLVERFANSLILGGYIFIGHAETLKGINDRFKMVYVNNGIVYRREK